METNLFSTNLNFNNTTDISTIIVCLSVIILAILYAGYKIHKNGNALKKINEEQNQKIILLETELAVTREYYNLVVNDLSSQINLNNLLRENLQYFLTRHINNNDTTNN